jgi:N-acetylmuramoyl-L-alanine amidase
VKLSWWIPLTVISILGFSNSAWAAKLAYWKFNKPLSRIELVTDEGVQPQAHFVTNPARVIIELPDTTVDKAKRKKIIKGTKYVTAVRVGQFDRQTTRLVVELAPGYTLNPGKIEIRGYSSTRWYIQLPKVLPLNTVPDQGRDPIAIEVPETQSPPPSSPTFPSDPSPSSEPSLPIKKGAWTVAIDPGHGGADVGAVGIGGMYEKVVVFSVAHQVAEMLRRQGVNAVMTRSGDQEVDLPPRVSKASRVGADAFVSIHANSISLSRPDINGLETYYYASRQGYRLARAIHNRILNNTNMQDRGIRQARFYVIRRTSMPATLVEIGFVTGSQDAARFNSAAQRTKLAEAITQGIMDYLQRR